MRVSAVFLAGVAKAQFGGFGGFGGLAHLRFGCSQLTIERLDPLVNPGQAPTPHMHQVIGGNAFNASMPSEDISELATCTTCGPADDLSNYWTANIYFKARNGTYKRVPQVPNRFLFNDRFTTQTDGGVTVYYISPGPSEVTAFQPGFRMFVGDIMRREPLYKSQSCFRCYNGPDFGGDDMAPCSDPSLDHESFPPGPCQGIRSNVLYPTCWDGKNLDSANHIDHIAYPTAGPSNFLSTGDCPASHPVKIPQLMLEIVWDTTAFNDPNDWPEDGSQPFVLSTGDNTGYGQHGDYVFGWKGDALQRAMDDSGCFSAECGNQKSQDISVAKQCVIDKTVLEDVDGSVVTGASSGIGREMASALGQAGARVIVVARRPQLGIQAYSLSTDLAGRAALNRTIATILCQQAFRAYGNSGAYGASKAGLVGLTRSQAEAWSSPGALCNAIVPGVVQTDMTASVFASPELVEKHADRTLIERNGNPQDFGGIVVCLADKPGEAITGQTMFVDGGYSAT